ncbi:sensor histidine kinase NtrY-like [Acidimangrovimonas sediminis]|uniref:sensor histidine kinase NtrY-like n=1 Tax=Acidimangrovimonas sediminis TaxID=2056283 RepID=UPI000C802831|nr:PAS domain-containing sensor histidine kinase [Acidimangrovimonas sediminis]
MQRAARTTTFQRFSRLRRQRRVQTAATFALVALGPILALLTFVALGPLNEGAQSPLLRLTLLGDLIYVLAVATMVAGRVARMVSDRRSHSAGSRLHLRLTGVFALIALIPTVLVAVFAGLTINIGLEGWFSTRVRSAVGASLAAAQAYEGEHRQDITQDADALANFLDAAKLQNFFIDDGEVRQLLTQGQARIQRGLRAAFVINGTGEIKARGDRSYLFNYTAPSAKDLTEARTGKTVIIEDLKHNEFRALVELKPYPDRYLYVTRVVDGGLIKLLDETKQTVQLYQQLERDRGRLLFEFGLLYLGFALILILAATWLGLWFAERLARPVGRLAGAAQRIGGGDLEVQVREEEGDDEIAMLGRIFNQMTRQLKGQREALMDSHSQTEQRRRQFDSVLSSITSGVVGLDATGRIDFVNRSALRHLDLEAAAAQGGAALAEAVPEFAGLFARAMQGTSEVTQEEIRVSRMGRVESLLVRVARRRNAEGQLEGYVVAFDDVTELVSAQRMAAWGDVARRIAHEIKNPLTPIQLSAERIKRKFRALAGEDAEALDQYTDVIVRQTGDLRRIVDEFSRFARMPEPERRRHDLVRLVRDAVVLQESGLPGIRISADLPEGALMAEIDATMISQALTNLIKNAGEAIETLQEKGVPDGYVPEVRVRLSEDHGVAMITIADNGIGLPEDRTRLFEPYVTTREKGTGLGLPIVKKIIEEHGGTLALVDAPAFATGARRGALAEIRLPLSGHGTDAPDAPDTSGGGAEPDTTGQDQETAGSGREDEVT